MKVLVACEYSGIVRDAFIAKGHDAISCDLIPTETPGPHYQGDVFQLLSDLPRYHFDLMIAHPPCTYLCNSGVRWLYSDMGRWKEMISAAMFYRKLRDAYIFKKCLENPIMHKYANVIIQRDRHQIVQPWMFGHGETKATVLELINLSELIPTDIVSGRDNRIHKMAPGPERSKERSRTFSGIAKAMAEQWG